MEHIGLYTGLLRSNAPFSEESSLDLNVGLDDLDFGLTQGTPQGSHDVPAENDEEVVELQAAQVAGRRSGKRGASHRSKKFDKNEDKTICSAWLNVSKDPIHGANQKSTTFWGRIKEYFDEHKESKIERTDNSIMHRWLIIQKDVNKFCAVYDKILRRNASGATIQDKINEALETYSGVDEENKSFTLMHCWDILKDEEKWKSRRLELADQHQAAAPKKKKTTKESTPGKENANNNDEVAQAAAPVAAERKRPPGQKQAKQARRGGDDAYIAALDKMWEKKEARDKERDKSREADKEAQNAFLEVEKASIELEKKRLSNEEKVAEANLLKYETEIMLANTSNLDEEQLQWHQIMKKKILARHVGN